MSNRPQSTPPTQSTRPAREADQDTPDRRSSAQTPSPQTAEVKLSPHQMAFRETFLWRFHRPKVAAALRLAGDGVIDLMNEAGEWGPEKDLPSTVCEVRSASDGLE